MLPPASLGRPHKLLYVSEYAGGLHDELIEEKEQDKPDAALPRFYAQFSEEKAINRMTRNTRGSPTSLEKPSIHGILAQ
jgi:hypothetical protein